MDWFLSLISIISLWLMGNKSRFGPVLGIIGQLFWIYYAISIKQFGLLFGTFVYLIVHIRNTIKWSKTSDKDSDTIVK